MCLGLSPRYESSAHSSFRRMWVRGVTRLICQPQDTTVIVDLTSELSAWILSPEDVRMCHGVFFWVCVFSLQMQYSFVYQALLEHYLYGDTELDVSSLEGHLQKLHNTFANGDRVGLEDEFKVRALIINSDPYMIAFDHISSSINTKVRNKMWPVLFFFFFLNRLIYLLMIYYSCLNLFIIFVFFGLSHKCSKKNYNVPKTS